jgi:hypothetical protein
MAPEIDKELLAEAKAALKVYIARKRDKGSPVEIEKAIYHKGLYNIRCVLLIDGYPARMYYRQSEARWERASR